MYRKYFFIFLAAVAALLLTGATASAQIERLQGQVLLKQADGNIVPVEKAVVEVFRTDRAGNKETKTDKKGSFTLALDVAGDYVLAVSAPNAQPQVLRAKVREEAYKITLDPGDGRRLTKDEVMVALSGKPLPPSGGTSTNTGGTTTGTESEEAKAKRAEIERKNEEIKAKNVKIEESNAVVARTFKAGNDALKAERYDEAIAQYNEGLAADPEQPALLTNKAVALTHRGVNRYNAAIKTKPADEAGQEAAKKDFREAVEAANKALELVNAEQVGADPAAQQRHTLSKNLALFAKAEAMRLFVTKVDPTQVDAGVAAYEEYIATLTDPAKKLEAQLMQAKIMFDTGAPDKAVVAYKKILDANPDNVDALLYTGLALFQSGDKTKYQEAANYLQRFVDKAPADHPLRQSAKESLDYLKSQENVTPQKTTSGRRRG
jgi:tetratricopeptide (TPR) repeat protein